VLSVQLLALMQAIDYLQCQNRLSSFTRKTYEEVRGLSSTITKDEPRYKELENIKKYLITLGSTTAF
jgi:histidine ammonia-lyase